MRIMNVTKRIRLFIIICFIMIVKVDVLAAVYPTTGGVSSSNVHKQNYPVMWTVPMTSFLYENENGNIVRVEYIPKTKKKAAYIVVEEYTSNYGFVSSKMVSMELEKFGGFFAGKNYNYFVFGQDNSAESDDVEVMRIVRYDKDFNRMDSDSLYGANTSKMFCACRLSEYGDMIYIRTAHNMYVSDDGLNHQANMTVAYQQSTGRITDSFTRISNNDRGYVSHSFNQFIDCSDGKIIAVDHGDAHPRAVVLQEYPLPAGEPTFVTYKEKVKNQIMLDIYGEYGDNDTGVFVGGFEQSDSHYIVAGNSMLQNEKGKDGRRNIFISTVSKDNVGNEDSEIKWITDYSLSDIETASAPQLVKINENCFMLLWETWIDRYDEYMYNIVFADADTCYTQEIKYVLLDGTGTPISKVCSYWGSLSDCKPILYNNRVVWYVTDGGKPQFYSLPIDGNQEAIPNNAVVKDDQGTCLVQINTKKKTAEFIEPIKVNNKTIVVPDTVTVLGKKYKVTTLQKGSLSSFIINYFDFSVKKVVIGKYISNLQKKDFDNIEIQHLVIKSDKLKTIKEETFSNCDIKKLTMQCSNLTKIEGDAFSWHAIKTVSIKAPKLTTIGKDAFAYNFQLKEINIESQKLNRIGNNAFMYCRNLRKVMLTSTKLNKKSIGSNAFYGTHKKLVVYVPKKKVKIYAKYLKDKGNKSLQVKKK